MSFPNDQVAELKLLCPEAAAFNEAGCTYVLLPGLNLPEGCEPACADALLCPTARDGYDSRLFFAEQIKCGNSPNWNATCVRIGERNWHAYSWRTVPNLRLAQMVAVHLRALR
jgi:hypothetical protein